MVSKLPCSFNPKLWFMCQLCRDAFSSIEKLKAHKIDVHFPDCLQIKCIVFEEKSFEYEWTPPKHENELQQNVQPRDQNSTQKRNLSFNPPTGNNLVLPNSKLDDLPFSNQKENHPSSIIARANGSKQKQPAKKSGIKRLPVGNHVSSKLKQTKFSKSRISTVEFNNTNERQSCYDKYLQELQDHAIFVPKVATTSDGTQKMEFVSSVSLSSPSAQELKFFKQKILMPSHSNLQDPTSYEVINLDSDTSDEETEFPSPIILESFTIPGVVPDQKPEKPQGKHNAFVMDSVSLQVSSHNPGNDQQHNQGNEYNEEEEESILEIELDESSFADVNMDPAEPDPAAVTKPYMCGICYSFFRTQQNLSRHTLHVHSTDRPYQCPHCPATFKYNESCRRHLILHGRVTPHRCRYCDKSCSSNLALSNHERTHTNDRPFKCEVPNCTSAFPSKTSLTLHTRMKHSEELGLEGFPCPFPSCEKRFGLRCFLNRHITSHHISHFSSNPNLKRKSTRPKKLK